MVYKLGPALLTPHSCWQPAEKYTINSERIYTPPGDAPQEPPEEPLQGSTSDEGGIVTPSENIA
jgi:hypothetical protein